MSGSSGWSIERLGREVGERKKRVSVPRSGSSRFPAASIQVSFPEVPPWLPDMFRLSGGDFFDAFSGRSYVDWSSVGTKLGRDHQGCQV